MTLQEYLANGTVWIEGSDYVARASDGVIVSIGNVGREEQVEAYLADNPAPSDW